MELSEVGGGNFRAEPVTMYLVTLAAGDNNVRHSFANGAFEII